MPGHGSFSGVSISVKEVHFTDEDTKAQISPVGTEDGSRSLKLQVALAVDSTDPQIHPTYSRSQCAHTQKNPVFSSQLPPSERERGHMPIKGSIDPWLIHSSLKHLSPAKICLSRVGILFNESLCFHHLLQVLLQEFPQQRSCNCEL